MSQILATLLRSPVVRSFAKGAAAAFVAALSAKVASDLYDSTKKRLRQTAPVNEPNG